jgi:hypothetical protein
MPSAMLSLVIAQIQSQLKRAARAETVNDARHELNAIVAAPGLTPDVALELIKQLLNPGDAVAREFHYRLDRVIRLELLLRLQGRLGRATAAQLYEDLTVPGEDNPTDDDLALQQGLRAMFPGAQQQELQKKFLEALRTPLDTKTPSVLLVFRTKHTFSSDNKCALLTMTPRYPPWNLGVDNFSGTNWMEIRGTVIGFQLGTHRFKFDRTIEMSSWYRQNGTWKWEQRRRPDTPDNKHDKDEYDFPDQGNIYSIDGPGPNKLAPADAALTNKADEYAWMMNATETVNAGIDQNLKQVASLNWFSVTWLEKASGGWRRKAGLNKIAEGSISGLANSAPPTTGW